MSTMKKATKKSVAKTTKISTTKAAEIITNLGGKFANVTFTKKKGEERNLTFCLVKDKNGKLMKPTKVGNLLVKDMFALAGDDGIRTIPLSKVSVLKANGTKYSVE